MSSIRINEYLEVTESKGEKVIKCRCGHIIGPANENYKEHVLRSKDLPLSKAGPYVNPFNVGGRFTYREFYCPQCITLLETEISLKGEPPKWDTQPAV